jgi:hypothetical protein
MVDKYVLTRDIFDNEFAFGGGLKDDLAKACLARRIPVDKSDKVDDLKAKLYGNKIVLAE